MSRISVVVLCAGVIAVPVGTLRAQSADTTTAVFREGQWGVGFTVGNSPLEGGVLRFATPTRAWVLDGSGTLARSVQPGAGVFGADVNATSYSIGARLGPRWYRAMSSRLARFLGVGILGDYSRLQSSGSSDREDAWTAGAYGEIGVQYMFTRHVGVGWRANVSANRSDQRLIFTNGTAPAQRMTSYQLTLQPVQVAGTIYF